ncbi:MAG: hypothetical protein WD342_05205 [Verrucomicrobiales bacterium]
MPVPPSIRKSIRAIRTFVAPGGAKDSNDLSPFHLTHALFRDPERIVFDPETLDAVLALAPEIEAYRGKGSQTIFKHFNTYLRGLVLFAESAAPRSSPRADLFPETTDPSKSDGELPYWVERLSEYFFERVRGKRVRSNLAARMRFDAWLTLGDLARFRRRPEHLSLAFETAADKRSSEEEREGAVEFLVSYWADDDPDEATVNLLEDLRENPPSRSFLVGVLQAQIELGLNDELDALLDVEDWDDAEDEED